MLLTKDSLAKVGGLKARSSDGQELQVQRIMQIKGAGVLSAKVHVILSPSF